MKREAKRVPRKRKKLFKSMGYSIEKLMGNQRWEMEQAKNGITSERDLWISGMTEIVAHNRIIETKNQKGFKIAFLNEWTTPLPNIT